MSRYTPLVPFATDFDGDHVTCNLRRLERGALLKLAPYLNDTGSMQFEDQAQFAEVMSDLLPEYVTDFRGLVDANGQPIDLDTVVRVAYFQALVGEIVGALLVSSKPTEDEVKNSQAGRADISRSASSAKDGNISAGSH